MPGASPSREEPTPLSLGVRIGLYAMLAGLVIASFTVTPSRSGRTAATAAPSEITADESLVRPAPHARGIARMAQLEEVLVAEAPPAQSVDAPAPAAEPEPLPEAAAPEATPEPTPAPPPRPAVRAAVVITSPTTAWAEAHMLELMNASRSRAGLTTLAMDITVADVARAHSAAEANVGFVYHDGPDGTARSRDVPACGTGWYGENTGKIWNDNVDALHSEFMAEPWEPINHRTNIMDPAFRKVGVGAVMGPDAMYMTMVFCR